MKKNTNLLMKHPTKFKYTSPITGKQTEGEIKELFEYKTKYGLEDSFTVKTCIRSTHDVVYPINENIEIYE